METFISSILENGLVKVELVVRPETAQHLYLLHLSGELSAIDSNSQLANSKEHKPVKTALEIGPIESLDDLEGNEITLLAALTDFPVSKTLPPSRAIVPLVNWQHYSKSGSDDETSRASSLRVTMQKLEKKGLLSRRGLKGSTERCLTEQGVKYAKQAQVQLQRYEPKEKQDANESSSSLPDFNPHGRPPVPLENFDFDDLFGEKDTE